MLRESPKKPRGRVTSLRITLTPEERRTLESWLRSMTMPAGQVRRARAILLRAEGVPILAIAAKVGVARRFVYKWVARFLVHGLDGLHDLPRPGAGSHRTHEPPAADHAD